MDRIEELAGRVRDLDARLRSRAATEEPVGRAVTDRLADRVEVLLQRVDTLSDTARAASSGLVAREQELAAIRRDLADARGRVDAAVADLQRRDVTPLPTLERTVAGLADDVAALQQSQASFSTRLDSLTQTTEATGASVTAHERTLDELSTELEAAGTRLDSVVVVVRQAIESLLSQVEGGEPPLIATSSDAMPAPPLDALTGRVEAFAADLESTSSDFAERERVLAESQRRLEARLDELAEKLVGREPPQLGAWGQLVPVTDGAGDEQERRGASEAELSPGEAGGASGDEPVGGPTEAGGDVRDPIVSFRGGT